MCLKCGSRCYNNTPVCIAHGALTDYHPCVNDTCDGMVEESELNEYCDTCNDINNGMDT